MIDGGENILEKKFNFKYLRIFKSIFGLKNHYTGKELYNSAEAFAFLTRFII